MNKRKDKPRFTLLVNERRKQEQREEEARRAELQKFIRACEALYEKNRKQL